MDPTKTVAIDVDETTFLRLQSLGHDLGISRVDTVVRHLIDVADPIGLTRPKSADASLDHFFADVDDVDFRLQRWRWNREDVYDRKVLR